MDGGPDAPAPAPATGTPPAPAARRAVQILSIGIAVYIGVSFTLSCLRLLEFTATNWDLGIFQQGLWTTTHGYTFFEVGDWEGYGSVSFLQVHPALVLYLLVPVYTLAPSPLTLLALQSVLVGLAAIPLYRIGLHVLGEPRRSVGLAMLYLAFAPVLTANLYDFHLEALLPLELFLVFLFWLQGRYLWGLLAAGFAFVSLEVTPFYVAAIALYFLLPKLRSHPSANGISSRASPSWWKRYLAERSVRWGLVLLVASGLAYLLLRGFEWWVLPGLLGVPPQPPVGTSSIVGPASPVGLGLTFTFTANLGVKLGYWGLLVALLGFLPLFSPRGLVLALPWFFFTMQSNHLAWVQLGYQYGFLSAIPLVLAAVTGLRRFEVSILPRLRRLASPVQRLPVPRALRRIRHPRRVAAIAFLLVLLIANVALTPVNPRMQNLNSALSGYRVSYTVVPGYSAVAHAAALIPPDSLVLSSDNLFPFVANDPKAYSLLWIPQQPTYLPFDPAHLPTFVFISSKEQFAEPSWLYIATSNTTLYGTIALVKNTPAGTVHLWERGYAGPLKLSVDATHAAGGPTMPSTAAESDWLAAAAYPWATDIPLWRAAFQLSTTVDSW